MNELYKHNSSEHTYCTEVHFICAVQDVQLLHGLEGSSIAN